MPGHLADRVFDRDVILQGRARIVDRPCQSERRAVSNAGGDDADDLAAFVDEWAAAVPRIDRRRGLQNREILLFVYLADQAGRDRPAQSLGIANGDDAFAEFDQAGIAQRDYMQVFGRDFETAKSIFLSTATTPLTR